MKVSRRRSPKTPSSNSTQVRGVPQRASNAERRRPEAKVEGPNLFTAEPVEALEQAG